METYEIMLFYTCKHEQERNICVEGIVVTGKLAQSISIKILFRGVVSFLCVIWISLMMQSIREIIMRMSGTLFLSVMPICELMWGAVVDSRLTGKYDTVLDGC